MKPVISLFVVLTAMSPFCRADASLAKIFGPGMVLQRGMKVPVWGDASPGENVEVDFAGQKKTTKADNRGHWRIELDPLDASADGRTFTVTEHNVLELKDVLVGEVWLCSGQSNMQYPMDRKLMNGTSPPPTGVKDVATESLASADDPLLRIFRVEKDVKHELANDGWHTAEGKPLAAFSAVGYFFGKNLRAKLNVPVGLIGTYWGGSRIERWTPEGAYANSPALHAAATQPGTMDGDKIGMYYSKMVAPMAGYALKGMIWYQGESNVAETNSKNYLEKFDVFAQSWRDAWREGDFPIGTVQITPYAYTRRTRDPIPHTPENLPEFWRIQTEAAGKIKNVGLVPTADLADHLTNIHPWNKWDVGQRLANWALATVYGKSGLEWTGPTLQKVTYGTDSVEVTFSHATGLHGGDGPAISEFQLQAADGTWTDATAVVEGDGNVKVSAENTRDPRGVRYAWRENAKVGLRNAAGLPAFAFETAR